MFLYHYKGPVILGTLLIYWFPNGPSVSLRWKSYLSTYTDPGGFQYSYKAWDWCHSGFYSCYHNHGVFSVDHGLHHTYSIIPALGHTLDLAFTGGHTANDLTLENTKIFPLSWTDHYLVNFRLTSVNFPKKTGGPNNMVCLVDWWKVMVF